MAKIHTVKNAVYLNAPGEQYSILLPWKYEILLPLPHADPYNCGECSFPEAPYTWGCRIISYQYQISNQNQLMWTQGNVRTMWSVHLISISLTSRVPQEVIPQIDSRRIIMSPLMHLSMYCPTPPLSGSRWGIVGI